MAFHWIAETVESWSDFDPFGRPLNSFMEQSARGTQMLGAIAFLVVRIPVTITAQTSTILQFSPSIGFRTSTIDIFVWDVRRPDLFLPLRPACCPINLSNVMNLVHQPENISDKYGEHSYEVWVTAYWRAVIYSSFTNHNRHTVKGKWWCTNRPSRKFIITFLLTTATSGLSKVPSSLKIMLHPPRNLFRLQVEQKSSTKRNRTQMRTRRFILLSNTNFDT